MSETYAGQDVRSAVIEISLAERRGRLRATQRSAAAFARYVPRETVRTTCRIKGTAAY